MVFDVRLFRTSVAYTCCIWKGCSPVEPFTLQYLGLMTSSFENQPFYEEFVVYGHHTLFRAYCISQCQFMIQMYVSYLTD